MPTTASYLKLLGVFLLITLAVFFLCMSLGPGDPGSRTISFHWPSSQIFELRLFRVLAAALVGFALAAAGTTLQALLRNPLADPYILGISTGSSIGVFIWLILTSSYAATISAVHFPLLKFFLLQGEILPALIGASATAFLVFAVAKSRWIGAGATADPLTLLLVGVVISAMNGAILMLLNWLALPNTQQDFLNYIIGIISNDVTGNQLKVAAVVLAVGFVPVLLAARSLNIATLSEMEATSLGINVNRLRNLSFVCASIMTAAAIMLAGPIGFVGLICPHICRRIVGSDHRKLLLAAPLAGATFLMLADSFVNATGDVTHGQLPVGIITALCGGPFFLILLKSRGSGGGVP